MAGRRKRTMPTRIPPTSHSEASMLNQRNPEGSVSNPPQLNDPDGPPPPQRPRASLPPSETAPLSRNRRGRQDANLTSPPPRNRTNAPSSSQSTGRYGLPPWQSAGTQRIGLGGNQPPVETRTVAIPQPPSSSSSVVSQDTNEMQSPRSSTSSSPIERADRIPSTLPQTAQASSSTMQRSQLTVNQELLDFLTSNGQPKAADILRTLLTPQPLQTPSSSQAAGSIVTGSPSDDRLGTLNASSPLTSPPVQIWCKCEVCGFSINEIYKQYGVVTCRACNDFYKRIKNTKQVKACTGNNDCANLRGRPSCQSCRYKRCLEVGMPRIENVTFITTASRLSPSSRPQSSASVHEPQAPFFILPSFMQEGQLFLEQLLYPQRSNRPSREAQTAAVPQPSGTISPSEPSAMPSRSGSPQSDIREIVVWGNGILSGKNIPVEQKCQILRTQWPMLMVLDALQKKDAAHEFQKPFEREFQECEVTKQEYEQLKNIALFMRPREPSKFTFKKQLDEQYVALSTLCSNKPARSENLVSLLTEIKYLNPIGISDEELAAIIESIPR